jgi:phosphohistidine phosphatase
MLTLSILRHAEAARDVPGLEDFDRGLTEEGKDAARRIGRWMQRNGVRPDLVLSSSSERTRATCEIAFANFEPEPETEYEAGFYLATPRTLLARMRLVPAAVRHLMLVGHNPGLHALATSMVGEGPSDLVARLDEDLPTCALVVIEIDASAFAAAKPGEGRLVQFVTRNDVAS